MEKPSDYPLGDGIKTCKICGTNLIPKTRTEESDICKNCHEVNMKILGILKQAKDSGKPGLTIPEIIEIKRKQEFLRSKPNSN